MTSLKKLFLYLLFLIFLLITFIVGSYSFLVYKPLYALQSLDKILLYNYSLSIRSIQSNQNFFDPQFTSSEVKVFNKKLEEVISIPRIVIGINLLESLFKDHLSLSILKIDSVILKGNSDSNYSSNPLKIKGNNLEINNNSLSISAASYEAEVQDGKVSLILRNGTLNSLPYQAIDALYTPSSNKVLYLSEHFLDTGAVDNLELFNASSLTDYSFNIKVTSKGFFDISLNELKSFNRMHFLNSRLKSKSGYEINSIESIIFSDVNKSLHGTFLATIPDQKIKGSISYDQEKVLSVRSDILIHMDNLISSNQYFNIKGDELFSALLKLGKEKISIQLDSNLQRTNISSPIKEIEKILGSSLMTSIYVDDLSKPSYLINNKKYDLFIDSDKSGYFILGESFRASSFTSSKDRDGFYVYLDVEEIKMEDYSFLNTSNSKSSPIKLVKIKTDKLNLFKNQYKDQLIDIYFDKKESRINFSGDNLNGKINIDKTGFMKINLENTKFKFNNLNYENNDIDSLSVLNIRFISKNLDTDRGFFETIDFYLLKNTKILTIDNINISSNGFRVGPYSDEEKAYISIDRANDLYKIKGIYEIYNSSNPFNEILKYDFNFLKTNLNVQWNSLSSLKNLEGSIDFLVKEFSLDANIPSSAFLRAIKVLNLNAMIDGINNQRVSSGGDSLKIQRASGKIYFSKARGIIDEPITLETNEASLKWLGEVLKNQKGEMDKLNLNLSMRLKISENIPWYAAIFGGIPALAGGYVLENIFEDALDNASTFKFKVDGTVESPELKRLN